MPVARHGTTDPPLAVRMSPRASATHFVVDGMSACDSNGKGRGRNVKVGRPLRHVIPKDCGQVAYNHRRYYMLCIVGSCLSEMSGVFLSAVGD